MSDDKMLERIRALLAKAEDVAGTPEADAYNEKVAELVAKYGIDQALLVSESAGPSVPGDKIIVVDAPYLGGKVELCCYVATALRCKTVQWKVIPKQQTKVHVFGMESDLERFDLLYTSLLLQASSGMMNAAVPYYEHARTFRNAWLHGFSVAVYQRLTAAETRAEREATAGQPGTALVLADRSALVESRRDEVYPNLSKGQARRVRDSLGLRDGHRAGQKADLGQTRLAPNRKALA